MPQSSRVKRSEFLILKGKQKWSLLLFTSMKSASSCHQLKDHICLKNVLILCSLANVYLLLQILHRITIPERYGRGSFSFSASLLCAFDDGLGTPSLTVSPVLAVSLHCSYWRSRVVALFWFNNEKCAWKTTERHCQSST